MTAIREPAVAGAFYPVDTTTLDGAVRALLLAADAPADGPVPKALIAPHAGYVYSGPVAALAYARLRPAADRIKSVVLIGPSHRVPFRGFALSSHEAYATPLGPVPVDAALRKTALDSGVAGLLDAAHGPEHSLEVHLPFLQRVLSGFTLLPVVAGDATPDEGARLLDALWGGPERLIVISTDLSHYLDYDACQALDARTAAAIETFDIDAIGNDQACGRIPVKGLLQAARARGLAIERVDLRNSGDTRGPRDRVVGYGAWALYEPNSPDDAPSPEDAEDAFIRDHGAALTGLAVKGIRHALDHGKPLEPRLDDLRPILQAEGASFVTLTRQGELRGCIGSLRAYRPLGTDIADNAFGAAFRDTRFTPLTYNDVPGLAVSVSVLSPAEPIRFRDEADLLGQIVPGRDGLILTAGRHRGLFLPAVWEQIGDRRQFLAHLKRKAGLPMDFWSDTVAVARFSALQTGKAAVEET